MTVKRTDNVGIVVEDIDDAVAFFTELGLELEGRAPIAGDMRVEMPYIRGPEGISSGSLRSSRSRLPDEREVV